MYSRLYALVGPNTGALHTKHYRGLPPEFTGGVDRRTLLPWPDVVLLEGDENGAMLYRYTRDAEFAGDTWAESLAEAKAQAQFEFGESLGEWRIIPEQIEDARKWAIGQIAKQ